MKEFYSLEEIADLLGVEYKTVYRLVRSGELPAAKLGRLYRVKKEDFDHFFEKQKVSPETGSYPKASGPQGTLSCASCGRTLVSKLSKGADCPVCGKPICVQCVNVYEKKFCKDHIDLQPKTEDKSEELKCGVCGKDIVNRAAAGGECRHDDCRALICRACVLKGHAFCAAHTVTEEEKVKYVEEMRALGKPIVTAGDAKGFEIRFIKNFKERIKHFDSYCDPATGTTVRKYLLNNKPLEGSSLEKVMALSKGNLKQRDIEANFLVDDYAVFTVDFRSPEKKTLLIGGFCQSHMEQFYHYSYDMEKGGAKDIVDAMNRILEVQEGIESKTDIIAIYGVMSPLGWDNEAVKKAQSIKEDVHIILIDPMDKKIIGKNDRLKPYYYLFDPHDDEEIINSIKEQICEQLILRNAISISEVINFTGYPENMCLQAMKSLEKSDFYQVDKTKNLGWVISRR